MANPKLSDVHVQSVMPVPFSVRRTNHPMVGTLVAPMLRVNKRTDKYFVFGDEHLRVPPTERGETARSNQVEYTLSTSSYQVIDHALSMFVPDSLVREADNPLDPMRSASMQLSEQMDLALEDGIATLMATSGNFGSTVTLSSTQLWSDYSSSDPVGDIQTAIDTIRNDGFREPNVMIVGNLVWPELRHHPQILERIKYQGTPGNPAQITLQALQNFFGIEKIVVGQMRKDTSNIGGTESLSNIWDDDVFLAYAEPPRRESYSWGKVFWTFNRTRRWRDEALGGGGTFLEMERSWDIVAVGTKAGYAIYNAI